MRKGASGSHTMYSKYCQPSYKKNAAPRNPGNALTGVVKEYAELLGGWDGAYDSEATRLLKIDSINQMPKQPYDTSILLASAVDTLRDRDKSIAKLGIDIVDLHDYKKWFGKYVAKRADTHMNTTIDIRYLKYAAKYGMPENGVFDEDLLNKFDCH